MAGKAKFEIYKRAEEYYWLLKAGNGEIIAISEETFETYATLVKSTEKIKKHVKGGKYRFVEYPYGNEFRWKLLAGNNEIMAVSEERFSTSSSVKESIRTLKDLLTSAIIPSKGDVKDEGDYVPADNLNDFYTGVVGHNRSFEIAEGTKSTNELEYIQIRRRTSAKLHGEDPNLKIAPSLIDQEGETRRPIGLAASGGGIRSATFNMGIMQALSKRGILSWIDYVSSVSGGGMGIGAVISLLSSRKKDKNDENVFETKWEKFPLNPDRLAFNPEKLSGGDPVELTQDDNYASADMKEAPGGNAIWSHFRNRGNYLIPRLGTFTRDSLRFIGGLLSKWGYTMLLVVTSLIAVGLVHYMAMATLIPGITQDIDISKANATPKAAVTNNVFVVLTPTPSPITIEDPDTASSAASLDDKEKDKEDKKPANYSEIGLLFGIYDEGTPSSNTEESSYSIPWKYYLAAFAAGFVLSYWFWKSMLGVYLTKKTKRVSTTHENVESRIKGIKSQAIEKTGFMIVAWLIFMWLIPKNDWQDPVYWVWLILIFGVLFLAILYFYLISKELVNKDWVKGGLSNDVKLDNSILLVALITSFGSNILFLLFMRRAVINGLPKTATDLTSLPLFLLWIPLIFELGVFVGINWFRISRNTYLKDNEDAKTEERIIWGKPEIRSVVATGQGAALAAIVILTMLNIVTIGLFFVGSATKDGETVSLITTILSGSYAAYLAQLFSKGGTGKEGKLKQIINLPEGIRSYALGILVFIFNLGILFYIESFIDQIWTKQPDDFLIGFLGTQIPTVLFFALLLLAAITFLLFQLKWTNFNHIAQFEFARDRVGEYYLSTEIENTEGVNYRVRDDRELLMHHVNPDGSSSPYHLVQAAMNLQGSWHLKHKDRKAKQFIFSRHFTGSDVTGYVRTQNYRDKETRYSRAIALSGAAFSSGVGRHSFFALSYMLTLLNLRLGQWILSPKNYEESSKKKWESKNKNKKSGKKEYYKYLFSREEYPNWASYLLDEFRGRIHERKELVNLVDGQVVGDNGGLYPLFKRRCKLIIAGDASGDPKGEAEELFRVLQQVKQEFGVRVDIDVKALAPATADKGEVKAGWSKNHAVVGEIHYPKVVLKDMTLDEQSGWLLYIKPVVTGDEPDELLKYWEMHKEDFPHPNTGDQFFDEWQLESQRYLGELSIEHPLGDLEKHFGTKLKEHDSKIEEIKSELEDVLKELLEISSRRNLTQKRNKLKSYLIQRERVLEEDWDKQVNPANTTPLPNTNRDKDPVREQLKVRQIAMKRVLQISDADNPHFDFGGLFTQQKYTWKEYEKRKLVSKQVSSKAFDSLDSFMTDLRAALKAAAEA